MGEGSLYPALHRLEERGWISAEWGVSENNRRAKYYALTRRGRDQLRAEDVASLRHRGLAGAAGEPARAVVGAAGGMTGTPPRE